MAELFDDAPQDITGGAGMDDDALLGGENSSAGMNPDQGRETRMSAAPAEYTDFSVPEGMRVDESLMNEFRYTAADMGLSQEAAQRLIDLQVRSTQAQLEAFNQMRTEWRSEFPRGTADPVVQDAAYVLKRFDHDGSLARELASTGQGDNPRVIRFLAAIRKEFREDSVYGGEDVRQDERPLRDRLWPDHTMPR